MDDRVSVDRFPPQFWIVFTLVLLTALYAVLQVGFVRPYLWPAGHGALITGEVGRVQPFLPRPPDFTGLRPGGTVESVADGSPAALAGVRAGDVIESETLDTGYRVVLSGPLGRARCTRKVAPCIWTRRQLARHPGMAPEHRGRRRRESRPTHRRAARAGVEDRSDRLVQAAPWRDPADGRLHDRRHRAPCAAKQRSDCAAVSGGPGAGRRGGRWSADGRRAVCSPGCGPPADRSRMAGWSARIANRRPGDPLLPLPFAAPAALSVDPRDSLRRSGADDSALGCDRALPRGRRCAS